ncbi:HdeA/HdeB family chaperone [Labrys portucalensis]|uniref:HdeA/HdeB family chaperone n=1 Tax=Labrys neptuniae TaxID=376174 RepID=A0ABV6ZK12_9HYPH|nr:MULTISPECIES: HdeA/HdeB family chaperone [Labrys]MDT3380311.1 HdeA/HdeB family chaperone [Labrys neptuniae]OCC02124.1 hypothetical protein BA190_25370 [Labrys sp. WJW]
MRGVIGAIVLSAMVHSGAALAQEVRRSAVGYMDVTCDRWTASANSTQGTAYAAWVAGFLSGANLAERAEDWLIDEDGTSIRRWISEYCKAHPVETLGAAAVMLRQALQQRAR